MKESLVAVLSGYQSLGHDDSRERPVDRLGALAYAQIGPDGDSFLASLGVDLYCLKYAAREDSREPAAAKLASVLGWERNKLHLSYKQCLKISRWAIGEWVYENCIACGGTKEVPNHQDISGAQPMKPCEDCLATGLRKWTDSERVQALGRAHGKPLGVAHAYIGASVAEAIRGAKKMLEHW